MSFKCYANLTLISIFLIIVAGSVVRITGSGMGCPDWPKCFGLIIPPTQVSQIQWKPFQSFSHGQMILRDEKLWFANHDFVSQKEFVSNNWTLYTKHDYHIFDPLHTWVEYINRLLGAISGLLTVVLFFLSLKYRSFKPKIVFLSGLVVFMMGFQAWLGATVVYSVLLPVKITIHMLMALLIVSVMVYLISEIPVSIKNRKTYDAKLYRLNLLTLLFSLIQITLGTQVRQDIDEISKSLLYQQRDLWIEMTSSIFEVHRSFAIFLVIINGVLFLRNFKLKLGFKLVNIIFAVIMLEVFSGVILTYFNMISIMQPVHLVAACLIFVLQISLFFELNKLRTN